MCENNKKTMVLQEIKGKIYCWNGKIHFEKKLPLTKDNAFCQTL